MIQKVFFYILLALYPILMFLALVILKLPLRILSLCIILLSFTLFISFNIGVKGKKDKLNWRLLLSSLLLFILAIICFITQKTVFLRLYSVMINLTFLLIFGATLFIKPNICFRFAVLMDKRIKGSCYENKVLSYCMKVTITWCIFFIVNGSLAFFTTFYDFGNEVLNNKVWSIYNGGVSYILMALLFFIEGVVRYMVDKNMIKPYPITKFTSYSRQDDYIMCYDTAYSTSIQNKTYKTWKDFLYETAKIRAYLSKQNTSIDKYLLHVEDYWSFLCMFVSLLQLKKTVYLTQNISSAFMDEILESDMLFCTDIDINDKDIEFSDKIKKVSINVNDIVNKDAIYYNLTDKEARDTPPIIDTETKIYLYTSGSTGHPKAVLQRMRGFEADNAFIISKWGEEIKSKILSSTVSQHHIYGFLFSTSLPFTLGIPFRRKRIQYVEEFNSMQNEENLIITTPAFLKRAVEIEERLPLKDTFIFTSGGACNEELARKTGKVFGVYPLEVYGSTETSGIAYRRQDTDGIKWTVFDNAKIWLGEDKCLRIISPYIKDPNGFATSDLAEIDEDGRFILKGRADSIVKIEEKRISLTEVEKRIMQTGFVKDVKVIALESDVRQYLAAVIVLNEEGKAKFKALDKHLINEYFHNYLLKYFENVTLPKKYRYVDSIPVDSQGKKHKEEIAALFT